MQAISGVNGIVGCDYNSLGIMECTERNNIMKCYLSLLPKIWLEVVGFGEKQVGKVSSQEICRFKMPLSNRKNQRRLSTAQVQRHYLRRHAFYFRKATLLAFDTF